MRQQAYIMFKLFILKILSLVIYLETLARSIRTA